MNADVAAAILSTPERGPLPRWRRLANERTVAVRAWSGKTSAVTGRGARHLQLVTRTGQQHRVAIRDARALLAYLQGETERPAFLDDERLHVRPLHVSPAHMAGTSLVLTERAKGARALARHIDLAELAWLLETAADADVAQAAK